MRLRPGIPERIGAKPRAIDNGVEQGDGDRADVIDRIFVTHVLDGCEHSRQHGVGRHIQKLIPAGNVPVNARRPAAESRREGTNRETRDS